MSEQNEAAARPSGGAVMNIFERYLSVWVALCIVAGIALGHWFPAFFQTIGGMEWARVNIPVALLIW